MTTAWFHKKTVNSWPQLYNYLNKYLKQPKAQWAFRGQSDNRELTTKIERLGSLFHVGLDKLPDYEWKLLREFRRRAHIYCSNPPKEHEHVEWLALLRHHEGPTRLLDFTYSPFIATFFALEMARENTDSVVWAIDKNWVRDRARNIVGREIFDAFATKRDGESFKKMFLENRHCFAGSVNPYRLNERLSLQQGVFLCPGDITGSFVKNLKGKTKAETLRKHICRIVISHVCRKRTLDRLRKMNIDRTTLFPGLDGFAQSLNTRFEEIGKMPIKVDDKWPKTS